MWQLAIGVWIAKSWLLCANDADIASLASWCTCHQKHPSFAGLRTPTGSYVSSQTAEYPQALADYDKEMLSLPRLSHRRALSHLSQLDSESSPRYFCTTSWIPLALWTRTRTRLQGVESSPSSAVRCSSVRRWPQSNETDCQQLDAHPWKNSLLVNSPRATISVRCFATIGSTCQRPRCGSTSPSSKWRPHGGIRTHPSWAYMAIKTIQGTYCSLLIALGRSRWRSRSHLRCSQSRPHLGQPLSISWAPLPRLWNRIPTLRFHWGQSCGNRTSAVVQWTILNDRSTTLETGTQKGCTEVHISVRGSGTPGALDGSIQSATLWPNGIVHTFKFRQHISWTQYQSSIEYERTYSNIPEVDFTMGLSTPYVAQHFWYCRAWQHMGRRP